MILEFERAGDPRRAVDQQRYMKSAMPYHGVPMPRTREIVRTLVRNHTLAGAGAWRDTILGLWRRAERREERYAAIEVLLHRSHRAWLVPGVLPLVEELVVTGAWWDYVDVIASRGMGAMLDDHTGPATRAMRRWAVDDNLWKRRTAILAQLGRKERTDRDLLFAAITASVDSKEFFLRKAIGWALREYSKREGDIVVAWVEDNADRLSPLSRREALKHLNSRRR